MRSKHFLPVGDEIRRIILELHDAGFESYVVGGAVRDHLLGRAPKDYDISTSATPEEARAVFGRKRSRIIGKRFRLVHLFEHGEIFEISTFRGTPNKTGRMALVTDDNCYGSAKEDAFRRDFTVNALFYDPLEEEIIDFTGRGMEDIERGVVRAIGNPLERFAEDPVRMLRALKLVGQYDFSLDDATENALFRSLPLIRQSSPSRLSLELEKILLSVYGDKHLRVFHDYGFLDYFLPEIERRWGESEVARMLELLTERNYRADEKLYRNSMSLAVAAMALPFVKEWNRIGIRNVLGRIFKPQTLVNKVLDSAERILKLQEMMTRRDADRSLIDTPGYAHSRELLMIRHALGELDFDPAAIWPPGDPRAARRGKRPQRGGKSGRGKRSGGRGEKGRGGREKEKKIRFFEDDED